LTRSGFNRRIINTNVFLRKLGKIVQNFCMRHSRSQPTQNIINGNSHSPDARLSTAFPWFDRNDVAIAYYKTELSTLLFKFSQVLE